ncbi:MAG: M20/M25/M40 family metallo-hydrolase [Defluviitaleaceae bacterium]|nr:M20/M25/M40 family metallo-hydrolase [Defluviitaleaceae bacterium]
MDSVKLIKDLTSAFGPPGFEEDVVEVAKKYVPAGYSAERDSIMNFFMFKDSHKENAPTILIDAHSDEIGLMVQAIKPNGTIVFHNLGGWVPMSLLAQRMLIRNLDGEFVTGVIAARAPHFGGMNEAPTLGSLVLDIGAADKAEAEERYKIAPGCPIVPKTEFEQQGDTMIAKAFDDRIGCAVVIEALEQLKDSDLRVVGTLSSQEEIGIRGAKVVANRVMPNFAICIEGAPADDTFAEPHMIQTRMGHGPMIRHIDGNMIANPRCVRFVREVAAKEGIKIQEAVRTMGGTNGGEIHTSGHSVPTIVVSCPVRYAHSHHSMISYSDYKACVALVVAIVKALNEDVIKGF